jgi:hypothetical protein
MQQRVQARGMSLQFSRRTLLLVAPTLLVFAIVGFLFGHSPNMRVETTREASGGVGSLDYPSASGWEQTSGAPTVPGPGQLPLPPA